MQVCALPDGWVLDSTDCADDDADYAGGAILAYTYAVTIEDSALYGNWSGYEGGAINMGSWDDPTITCDSCTFVGNTATYGGGAVNLGSWDAGTFNAASSTFTGNSSSSGGAFSLGGWGSPTVNLENCFRTCIR